MESEGEESLALVYLAQTADPFIHPSCSVPCFSSIILPNTLLTSSTGPLVTLVHWSLSHLFRSPALLTMDDTLCYPASSAIAPPSPPFSSLPSSPSSGGMEVLFSYKRSHPLTLPATVPVAAPTATATSTDGKGDASRPATAAAAATAAARPVDLKYLIDCLVREMLTDKSRTELFAQGETV